MRMRDGSHLGRGGRSHTQVNNPICAADAGRPARDGGYAPPPRPPMLYKLHFMVETKEIKK